MGKWAKRVIKVIVILLCMLIVWRVWLLEDESIFGDFVPTYATAEVYNADGSLEVLTNNVAHEMSEEGYFSVYGVYYAPAAKELQVTVRYNENSVSPLGDIYFLGYTVDTSGEPVATVTGEEGTETDGVRLHEGYPMSEIITPEKYGSDERLFYGYEKLIFKGVEIDEYTNMIISLCTGNSIDEEKAVIVAHFAEQPFEEYKLSKSEKNALASYKSDS